MKSLRKSILTLLALTLFGGAGAWAQGPTQVTQFTTDMLPASWATDNSDVTLADMQALGLEAVDLVVIFLESLLKMRFRCSHHPAISERIINRYLNTKSTVNLATFIYC